MTDKSRKGITGSTLILLLGIFAFGAVLYAVLFARPEGGADLGEQVVVAPEAALPTDADQAEVSPEAAGVETQSNDPAESDVAVEEDVAPAPTTAAPEGTATEAPPEDTDTAVEILPQGPEFDVVRVDREGGAVIAGQAAPGATVILSANGQEVSRALADQNGKFVALFDLPPSETPRSLSASMQLADGGEVASQGTVLIAPTRAPRVADAETQDADDATAREGVEVASESVGEEGAASDEDDAVVAQVAPQSASDDGASVEAAELATNAVEQNQEPVIAETDEPPAAPAIVLADETGITVLQPTERPAVPTSAEPSVQAPDVVANLVIDTITYGTDGEVALSGRGEGASFARVYLNDRPVQTVKIEPDGTWRTPLPDVDAGVYRLRIDEVTAQGDVTSRVETPFQREEPDIVQQAAQQPNAVTVQEGFTLWAIAEDRFGSGTEYVRVYEANRDLIRNPDLIYPGQIFELPEG